MDHQRTLVDTSFADDDGAATPGLVDALTAAGSGQTEDYLRAIIALCAARVMVPVVATRTVEGQTVAGLTSDKEAEMAVVLLQTGDRTAMVAFTSLPLLESFNAQARPVPVTIDLAAAAAVQEGAEAILIDLGTEHRLVLAGEVLQQLAQRHRLVELPDGGFGWAIDSPGPEPAGE